MADPVIIPNAAQEQVAQAAEHASQQGVMENAQELFFFPHRRDMNPPRPGCPYGNCGYVLGAHDVTGTTYYVATNMMLALLMFMFVQSQHVPKQWKTPVSISTLIAGVSWYNYSIMKDSWIETQVGPMQYRYNDWLITVPLMMLQFYFIVRANGPAHPIIAFRLFFTSLGMVCVAWLAIINIVQRFVGFGLALFCYYRIVNEVFNGDCGQGAEKMSHAPSKKAFMNLRLVLCYGWISFLLLGLVFSYTYEPHSALLSSAAMQVLNVLLNLCDVINKMVFCVCVWEAAAADKDKESLLERDSERHRSSRHNRSDSPDRNADRAERGEHRGERSERSSDRHERSERSSDRHERGTSERGTSDRKEKEEKKSKKSRRDKDDE